MARADAFRFIPGTLMFPKNSAYPGSFLVHAAIVAVCVGAASLLSTDRPGPPSGTTQGPVIILEPGEPGGGSSAGGSPRVTAKPLPRFKSLDSNGLLETLRVRKEEERAEAERARALAANRAQARPTVPSTAVSPARVPPAGTPGLRARIVGAQVDGATTTSVAAPGLPGSGGDATLSAAWATRVRAAFSAKFLPLFREKGGESVAGPDSCEVCLEVSGAGRVSFSRWMVRPASALMEKLILESVEGMGTVAPPETGAPVSLIIPVSWSVEN